jgi:hypothetical protein
MALALRMGMGEMWSPLEMTFLALVRELPDEYIVVDQSYSGAQTFVRDGGECCLDWGALVLGPGMAALIHVATYGDFVSLEDKGKDYVLTYLDEDGCQQVDDSQKGWMVSIADATPSVSLEDIIRAIARAEEHFPEDFRRFFANLNVGRATVLPYARHEWDPAVSERLGHERLYTMNQLTAWLREMSDSTVFQMREWDEAKVRTLLNVLGANQKTWEQCWEEVEEQKRARALVERDTGAISDQALREQVSQAFPFPLADSFRVVATPQEPRIDYPEKLRCAENFLAYLGSLGVALAQAAGLSLKPGDDLKLDLVRCWTGGISAGQWTHIVRETTRALHILGDPDGVPIPEFSSLSWKAGRKSRQTRTAEMLERLVQLRNDFHHNRGPRTPEGFEEAAEDIRHILLEVLRNSRFLARYPLWYVTDCEAQRRSSLFRVTYKLCMGDHPRFAQHEAQHNRFLMRRCVYLRSGGRLFDLTPWILLRVCPICSNEAMFFVETITYKSFERGHTDQCTEYWEDIARPLGLIE